MKETSGRASLLEPGHINYANRSSDADVFDAKRTDGPARRSRCPLPFDTNSHALASELMRGSARARAAVKTEQGPAPSGHPLRQGPSAF